MRNHEKKDVKVLVLGASGMLGNAVFRLLSQTSGFCVKGTVRSKNYFNFFKSSNRVDIVSDVDVNKSESISKVINELQPEVVINCIGLVKQLSEVEDPLVALPINSMLPHRLSKICNDSNARFIHISTDCVFTGTKGMYTEEDITDSQDLYGVSKRLGEVTCSNAVTLRTSIIGHELKSKRSLIDWFLSQKENVKGYNRAIFSGLPTVEMARIIANYVIPNPNLTGLYHVSADPINKYELLSLVAEVYGKDIKIEKDDKVVIDRSLDSTKFRELTGYFPPSWRQLVVAMRDFS